MSSRLARTAANIMNTDFTSSLQDLAQFCTLSGRPTVTSVTLRQHNPKAQYHKSQSPIILQDPDPVRSTDDPHNLAFKIHLNVINFLIGLSSGRFPPSSPYDQAIVPSNISLAYNTRQCSSFNH
jgi:hypothetical protein